MARINIEDDFWDDVGDVVASVGDKFRAYGMVLAFIKASQSKFKQNEAMSDKEFSERGFDESLVGPFAVRTSDGIVARGSDKHFSWLNKRKEAGKSGGKQTQAKRSKTKQSQPSYSSSLSSSSSSNIAIAPASPSPNPVAIYIKAYGEKYGHRPEVGPREGKILKTFAENHPDRWQQLIIGYLSMPDSWAVQRSHPVEVLVAKVNEIGRFLATGKVVTKKVVAHAEELVDRAQGTNRRPQRPIEDLERERAEMLADAEASVVKIEGAS